MRAIGSGTARTATIADTTEPTESPEAAASSRQGIYPKAISENAANSVAIGTDASTVRYYEQQTGKAFLVHLDTQRTDVLSDRKLAGFIKSYWIPKTNAVISAFQQSDGVRWRWFDYGTKETKQIGSVISALAVSPDGQLIVYSEPEGESSVIFVSAVDGSYPKKLLTTRAENIQLDWPRNNAIIMTSQRPDRQGKDLSSIDLHGNLTPLIADRENLEYSWSPDGLHLLFSYFSPEQEISLWYRDISSGADVPLDLATSAKKCAWHTTGTSITCGIPAKNTLTHDIPADHTATIDDIVTLDLLSGQQQRLYAGTRAKLIGIIDPINSSDDRFFIFSNLFDQRLFMLPL